MDKKGRSRTIRRILEGKHIRGKDQTDTSKGSRVGQEELVVVQSQA
jgi:hypothetical protein